MSDINSITIVGRMVRDAEMRRTQTGKAVCSFSIAASKTKGSGENKVETVSFFNCEAWEKLAELICQYVKKGDRIALRGELSQDRWEKDGKTYSSVKISVSEVQFLSQKNQGQEAPANSRSDRQEPEDEYEAF